MIFWAGNINFGLIECVLNKCSMEKMINRFFDYKLPILDISALIFLY